MNTFTDLSLSTDLVEALGASGITKPTPIQCAALPRLLTGENLLFSSETGTGKTLCYLLPAFEKCRQETERRAPAVLIIAPTHELASQIKRESLSLAERSHIPVTTALLVGGAPLKRQIDVLKQKPRIVVGGPARIIELVRLKKLDIRSVSMLVLDEIDRMLAPEMRDMVKELILMIPDSAQLIACSATISAYQARLVEDMARESGRVKAAPASYIVPLLSQPSEDILTRNITHWALYSEGRDKIETLRKFIIAVKPERALVFTSVVGQVENIASKLSYNGISCASLHAKLDKIERKKAMDGFRAGKIPVLVTSDLAARGLDIPSVTHIIQMDVNENEDFFIHRAGRTARAGKSGINVIMGDELELRSLARIEKKLGIIIYPKVLWGGVLRDPDTDTED